MKQMIPAGRSRADRYMSDAFFILRIRKKLERKELLILRKDN